MKDTSILDSAGPLLIVGFLAIVLVVATWIMVEYQGDWGSGPPDSFAVAPADGH